PLLVNMVLYFTSNAVNPPAVIYMGKDKFEKFALIPSPFLFRRRPYQIWFSRRRLVRYFFFSSDV
ncbi:hypothetical protein INT44_007404, partial [Umbelopsis vinacea]